MYREKKQLLVKLCFYLSWKTQNISEVNTHTVFYYLFEEILLLLFYSPHQEVRGQTQFPANTWKGFSISLQEPLQGPEPWSCVFAHQDALLLPICNLYLTLEPMGLWCLSPSVGEQRYVQHGLWWWKWRHKNHSESKYREKKNPERSTDNQSIY